MSGTSGILTPRPGFQKFMERVRREPWPNFNPMSKNGCAATQEENEEAAADRAPKVRCLSGPRDPAPRFLVCAGCKKRYCSESCRERTGSRMDTRSVRTVGLEWSKAGLPI